MRESSMSRYLEIFRTQSVRFKIIFNKSNRKCAGGLTLQVQGPLFPLFQGYEGLRESLTNKKNSALKSVDSNMNKKSKKKQEEETELPSKTPSQHVQLEKHSELRPPPSSTFPSIF